MTRRDAWKSVEGTSTDDAQAKYVEKLLEVSTPTCSRRYCIVSSRGAAGSTHSVYAPSYENRSSNGQTRRKPRNTLPRSRPRRSPCRRREYCAGELTCRSCIVTLKNVRFTHPTSTESQTSPSSTTARLSQGRTLSRMSITRAWDAVVHDREHAVGLLVDCLAAYRVCAAGVSWGARVEARTDVIQISRLRIQRSSTGARFRIADGGSKRTRRTLRRYERGRMALIVPDAVLGDAVRTV